MKNKTIYKIKQFIKQPAFNILIISLLLTTIGLIIYQHNYSYASDDVSWQVILSSWKPFSGQIAYVGSKDIFLANAPFIYVFKLLVKNIRLQILIITIFLADLNFILFYIASLYFIKKFTKNRLTYWTLLPFVWLASLSVILSSSFVNPNWRTFEFGLSFIYYMLAFKYYFQEIDPLKKSKKNIFATILILAVTSLMIYSDPWFVYFVIIPIIILFVGLWLLKKITKQKVLTIITMAIISFSGARVLTSLMARIGILSPTIGSFGGINITHFNKISPTIHNTIYYLANLFNINFSSFFNSLMSLVSLLIIFTIIYYLANIFFRKKQFKTAFSKFIFNGFLVMLIAFTIGSYIVDDDGVLNTERYLILLIFIATLLLLLIIHNLKSRDLKALTIILSVAIILNIINGYNAYQKTNINKPNQYNYSLINTIKKLGLTKGYAGYWNANINTYLSKDKINFLPIICNDKNINVPYPLLNNSAMFKKPAQKTFLIVDKIEQRAQLCSLSEIYHQFKPPEKVIKKGGTEILIYNYDILNAMPHQSNF